MNVDRRIISMLKEEFNQWEDVLAGLTEEQITAPQLPANLSIKDVIAHLMAWQQVSIARLEAAQLNKEPMLPNWLAASFGKIWSSSMLGFMKPIINSPG